MLRLSLSILLAAAAGILIDTPIKGAAPASSVNPFSCPSEYGNAWAGAIGPDSPLRDGFAGPPPSQATLQTSSEPVPSPVTGNLLIDPGGKRSV
jgi:hypothetical protein